jgi:hypothetical protein
MSPIEDGLPSYLQWGFACVRSRAFRLGAQAFGCVPFLDFANHADNPNADIRVVAAGAAAAGGGAEQKAQSGEEEEGGGSSVSGEQGFVELVALADIAAGSEVTMSYSGQEGYTNQVGVRACYVWHGSGLCRESATTEAGAAAGALPANGSANAAEHCWRLSFVWL